MSLLRVSFKWDADEEISYDVLLDRLAMLGAYDIESDELPPESKMAPPRSKKPSTLRSSRS
jgi:hypothetical protein